MKSKEKGIKLSTINNLLRRVGLVLVVAIDPEGKIPTRFWIERQRDYQLRCKATNAE